MASAGIQMPNTFVILNYSCQLISWLLNFSKLNNTPVSFLILITLCTTFPQKLCALQTFWYTTWEFSSCFSWFQSFFHWPTISWQKTIDVVWLDFIVRAKSDAVWGVIGSCWWWLLWIVEILLQATGNSNHDLTCSCQLFYQLKFLFPHK